MNIKTLLAEEKRLGLNCNYCGRFRYLNHGRFAPSTPVEAIAKTLTCARCGSEDVETFAVTRTSEKGYWPAERS
ncbi:hypothetical protein J0X15_05770 [Roseibium sp. CAU 1637]|uniref:Uncharacterized protein n=1 Tax=Roseibium limicola TaxID=2816037 RepID=A0A939ENP7_9HYPH|nr:hypothetical protein [Roseibium limicola]MBO0344718.1 hypothetical protein [Roseibium limicola]